jgi:hypothetical protein
MITTHRALSCVLGAIVCILIATAVHAQELAFDFRGRPYDPKLFRTTGSNHKQVVTSDARGLRITLPADHVNGQPVGIVASGVKGDFEITMDFEFLDVEKPTGANAGVSIYLTLVSPTQDAVSIGRYVRPNGESICNAHRATTIDGKRQHRSEAVIADALFGKLRLVRTGTTLSYRLAEADGDEFREIHQIEVGVNDVEMVRFAAEKGKSPSVVDVRINAISIRTGGNAAARPAPRPRWPFVVAAAIGAGIVVIGVAICVIWFWPRESKPRKVKPPAR